MGRLIESFELTPGYLRGGASVDDLEELRGARVAATRRIGKLLLVDAKGPDGEATLGLRFGMTGRLLVDDEGPIDELLYSTTRDDPTYRRFTMGFEGDGALSIVDPRRLGWVELAPDETELGPDAFSISGAELAGALRGGRGALKSRLMDQRRVAGVGNLICDETLWRAGLSPLRPAGELSDAEVSHLADTLVATIADLLDKGGSHMGDVQGERHVGGRCPRDGEPLSRDTVGGRTTYWCASHQR